MRLLIPGPVTTNPAVRAAMAQDLAPWDDDFRPLYSGVRERLLRLAGGETATHATLPLQGCGHFGLEAALRAFVPSDGTLLVPDTGAYADRLVRLARELGRTVSVIAIDPDAPVPADRIAAALADDPDVTHVALVYSETGTGVIHDPAAIGAVVRSAGRRMLLDAVSAFGALPLDIAAQPELDAVVFTSNKCLEAPPGLTFVVARLDRLPERGGEAGSWCLDLADIRDHTDRNGWGSFRFTPPAQVLAAVDVALDLLEGEGGPAARLARYRRNADVLRDGMIELGLEPWLPAAVQGPIVTNIRAPADAAWDLRRFVDRLKSRGYLISNFHNTTEPSFRVGTIGALDETDMRGFTAAADAALRELGVRHRGARRRAA